MFTVTADSIDAYFAFDPKRCEELERLDAVIMAAAPGLERHFHPGTPHGQPGMRMAMIGYGRSAYTTASGAQVAWPAIGVALQKNYISVYVALSQDGAPLLDGWRERLNALRTGERHFSFDRFERLDAAALTGLFAAAGRVFATPGPLRASEGA